MSAGRAVFHETTCRNSKIMAGILEQFRQKIIRSVLQKAPQPAGVNFDDKIALGVLLHAVAKADEKVLLREREHIRGILQEFSGISEDALVWVLEAVEQAEEEGIDFFAFTHEISRGMRHEEKKNILENLFRVACVDKDLAQEEHELIRKISGLLLLSHKDFIDAKIKVKKEFGMDTAGL